MPFAQFMQLALYHSQVGYYHARRSRVGYEPGTDFFTATSSGSLFGELVASACVHLLAHRDPKDFTFVEIGAEKSGGVLKEVAQRFGAQRLVHLGEPLELTGKCVVFSNELFDAQPFRRFVSRDGTWRELGVALRGGELHEVELLPQPTEVNLPSPTSQDYVFDAPIAASDLAAKIAAQPWTGLFVACDYGKSWRELSEDQPAGTARAYYRHQQSNHLLERPGEQDLTCHICWDWLSAALQNHGFRGPSLESQEAFFIRHAADFIAATSTAEAGHFSQKKLGLLQLLHPSHLGQKFQVLHALRD